MVRESQRSHKATIHGFYTRLGEIVRFNETFTSLRPYNTGLSDDFSKFAKRFENRSLLRNLRRANFRHVRCQHSKHNSNLNKVTEKD